MARNGEKKTQKQKSLPFIQPDAAGIDIGATEIYVAVSEERDNRPVRKSGHLPRSCTPWPTGSLPVQSKRSRWNPQGFTGSPFSRSWSAGGWKFVWSTPAMSKECRGAKPTSRTASGCNTSTAWDCCEALSGLRKPFVRFAAFCAIATPCSRAPRARCYSCKRPSPR